MKQKKLPIYLLLLAALSTGGCSNEDEPGISTDPANDPDAVELGITAGVTLTKSVINEGQNDPNFKSIAVYAIGEGISYKGKNNYALYTKDGNTWKSGIDKIYLTNETATIYGYHPAYTPNSDGSMTTSPLKITDVADNSTIPVTVFPGTSNKDTYNTIPVADNSTGSTILSAPGEVDYMWAEDAISAGNQATASNGKATPAIDASVDLKMKHAMAMVSFRIYNDGTYANAGNLTKIVLSNKSDKALSQGTSPTMAMAIKNGTITSGAEKAVTYTRYIGTGYTLKKQGDAGLTGGDAAKNASSKFSILVMPHNGAKNTIQVEFTIDGAAYTVDLASTTDAVNWAQGTNTIYTAKLSGKELELSTVTVEAWGSGASTGELPVK